MVQKLVKDLIVEHHKRRPSTSKGPKEASGADENIEVDRPSYIDMERQASQTHGSPSENQSILRLVDVRT